MSDQIRFLAMTPNLDRAFREKLLNSSSKTDLTTEENTAKRQELLSDTQEYQQNYEYNGYFTIKLRTTSEGDGDDAKEVTKIVVCDGATYDDEKGTSDDSLTKVNNATFPVKYEEFDAKEGKIYLMYVPEVKEDGSAEKTEAYVKIIFDDKFHDHDDDAVYLVGECTVDSETKDVKIIQRHGTSATMYMSNGIAYIEYIIECA